MSFPYMNPQSIIFTLATAANIGMRPIFKPLQKVTITGVSLTSGTAVNVADAASEIRCNLVDISNATNVIAALVLNTASNLIANTACEFTLNTTLVGVAAGTILALNVGIENIANKTIDNATYQIDYVQGSPGSEG